MNVEDLLHSEWGAYDVRRVADAALAAEGALHSCPAYRDALQSAVSSEPPPFGTTEYSELFRDASADARWLAVSLITNAEREGDGAGRLWSLAACATDQEHQRQLKAHAIDESRHSLMYLTLLDHAFPRMTAPPFRKELRNLSPRYSPRLPLRAVPGSPYAKPPSLDDFIQMNIAEIRTSIHHFLQRSALASHVPPRSFARIMPILDRLLRDEFRHVAYTARIIEQWQIPAAAHDLPSLFRRRLRDFNRITNDELGERAFDCSVSCCAKRPQCRARAAPVGAFADLPL